MKKIKVRKLTEEAFSPFGLVIGTEGRPCGGEEGVYRWYEKQAWVYGAKTVSFEEILRFDATRMRKRVFFALSSAENYLLFSNAYGDLKDLIHTLIQRLPAAAIGEDIPPLAENPPLHHGSIFTLWLMAGILGVGIFLQIQPLLS